MRFVRFLPLLAMVLWTLTSVETPALAGPKDLAIYVTRLGGDSATAQPYIDKFLRYVESAAGWAAAAMKGSFLDSRKDAEAFVTSTAPGIGIMDPPLYFEMKKTWGLTPILQVESKELVSPRFHVVVKDPAIKTLADLKGKRVWTTMADYPRYLSKVVLNGQADAAVDFKLKRVGQALRGIRSVLRGDCEATILDDEQVASAKTMTGGTELRTIHTSPALAPIPVVAFGDKTPEADRKTLVATLLAMCASSKGGPICKEMHIDRFLPYDSKIFDDVQKRFGE